MAGFLGLYNGTERVTLAEADGVAYWVDIKRHLSRAETARADALHIAKRVETTVDAAADGEDAKARSVATVIDQRAHDTEVLAASIVAWNLTDEGDLPLPLPPYIPPDGTRVHGDDPANRVRRESIAKLPAVVVDTLLKRIEEYRKKAKEQAKTFPGEGSGAPETP